MQIASDRAHRAGAERGAVHDRGVELDLAEDVGPTALADRPDALVDLDQLDAGLDRVERGLAFGQEPRGDRHARRALVVGDNDHWNVSPGQNKSGRSGLDRCARPELTTKLG